VIVALIGAAATILAAVIGRKSGHRKPGSVRRLCSAALPIGVLAGLVLLVGYWFGKQADSRRAKLQQAANIGKLTESYTSLINQGLTKHKRYIMPAVLLLVTLERSTKPNLIDCDRRIIYELQGLSTISKTPSENHNAFVEEYHSNGNFVIDPMTGTDPQSITENPATWKQWNVWFDLPAGGRRLVMTGAHTTIPLTGTPGLHNEHMFDALSPTEEGFFYPNDEGDIIEDLVIIVQSQSLDLYLPSSMDDNAVLQLGPAERRTIHTDAFISNAGSHKHQSFVARFENVAKGDIAGLRIGWRIVDAMGATSTHGRAN
jgi:hypothetical protein